jgi:5-methylcytosine-specific restriction protein A
MTNILSPVTGKAECVRLFEVLRDQWTPEAEVFENKHVAFRGGGYNCTVYWRPKEQVWGLFETPPDLNRFWIGWGTEDPMGSFSITVETNPPLEGYNRRCSGAFLRDTGGRIYLGHSGRVGGGRKGIGKTAFCRYTDLDNWAPVHWPDSKYTDYLLLGQIGGNDLKAGIVTFVHEVARFKDWAVTR